VRLTIRWVTFVLVMLATVAIAYAAYTLAGIAWNGVVEYQSPYARLKAPHSPDTPPVSPRVVVVILDGLRLDAARTMPTLNRMSDYGSDYVLTAPQPSLSYPNWTTILSGAPPFSSGVVTNWHEGATPVETLLDSADRAGVSYVVVGPSDIATLFPAAVRADGSFFKEWSEEYLAGTYVDATIKLVAENDPQLVVLHVPDIDEAGHAAGGASARYAQTVAQVDGDLRRLVEALQTTSTTFVFVADHGHIDTGGHGGWEDKTVALRGVFGGAGVNLTTGEGSLEDVAPTVAVLAGIPVPSHSSGEALASVVAIPASAPGLVEARKQRGAFAGLEADTMLGPQTDEATRAQVLRLAKKDPEAGIAAASAHRLELDRLARIPYGAALAAAALIVLAAVGFASWRALVASGVGMVAYYLVYNGLFFIVHDYQWSLSAFNSEDLIDSWMNQRMLETVIAALIGAAIAGLIYPALRRYPNGPRGVFLPGWLTLGPTVVLVTQATLALQASWFIWWWGVVPEWRLPDLMWGFKFDLDLVQMTALGAAALVAPVVTYLVGRYHHLVRAAEKSAG